MISSKSEKIKIFISSCFVVLVIFIIFYLYAKNFNCTLNEMISLQSLCLSKDKGDWGAFGDFIGGILNPTLTLIVIFIAKNTYIKQLNQMQKQEDVQSIQRFIEVSKSIFQSIELELKFNPAKNLDDYRSEKYLEHTIKMHLVEINNSFYRLTHRYEKFDDYFLQSALKQLGNDKFWDFFYFSFSMIESFTPELVSKIATAFRISDRCGTSESSTSDFVMAVFADINSMHGLCIYITFILQSMQNDKIENDKKIKQYEFVLKKLKNAIKEFDDNSPINNGDFQTFMHECFELVFRTR